MNTLRVTYIEYGRVCYRDFHGMTWFSVVSSVQGYGIADSNILSIEALPEARS